MSEVISLSPGAFEASPRVRLEAGLKCRHDPAGETAQAISDLRNQLLIRHFGLGRKSLAVCSVNEGDGCTFTAANLAYSLSQTGLRTVLVDVDFETPSLDQFFHAAARPPTLLSHLRPEGGAQADHPFMAASENLDIVYAAPSGEKAPDLTATAEFEAFIDFCMRNYDATVIDTPPANLSAGARAAARAAGYALMVARKHRTYVPDLQLLAKELKLDGAKIVGSVLVEL
jgi:Mrp family chromosome partitioning ATPase